MDHLLDTTAYIHLALALIVFLGARLTPRWPGVISSLTSMLVME